MPGAYKKRATVVQCSECSCILSRDMMRQGILSTCSRTIHHTTNKYYSLLFTKQPTWDTTYEENITYTYKMIIEDSNIIEIVFETVIQCFRLLLGVFSRTVI